MQLDVAKTQGSIGRGIKAGSSLWEDPTAE